MLLVLTRFYGLPALPSWMGPMLLVTGVSQDGIVAKWGRLVGLGVACFIGGVKWKGMAWRPQSCLLRGWRD